MLSSNSDNAVSSVRFSKYFFLFFLLIVWHFEPAYFSKIKSVDLFFSIGKTASFIAVLLLLLVKRNIKITWMFLSLITYSVVLVLSTAINGGAITTSFVIAFSMVAFFLIVREMLETDTRTAVSVLMLIFECLIYANLIIMYLYPRGLYRNTVHTTRFGWLFGHQNSNILYVLGAICIAMVYFMGNRNAIGRIRAVLLILMSSITVAKTGSANGLIGFALFFILLIVNAKRIRINVFYGLLITLVLFVIIVVLRKQRIFAFLIDLLNRDVSFSGRDKIWNAAIRCFHNKPWFGYGVESSAVAEMRFGGVETTHNKILFALYQGGVALTIPFFGIILAAAKNLANPKMIMPTLAITGAIISLLIQMQAESYNSLLFFFFFFLSEGVQYLTDYCYGELGQRNHYRKWISLKVSRS